MKKSLPYDELSTKRCSHEGCRKLIKQRLVNQKLRVHLCYHHYKELRLKTISDDDILNRRY